MRRQLRSFNASAQAGTVDAELVYGATGNGTTDDGPALQAALDGCPAGGIVDLRAGGVYRTKQTLVIPPRVTLRGTVAPHWPVYEDDPQFSCCIKPYSGSFTGTALIQFKDVTDGAYSTVEFSAGQRLINVALNGVGATGPAGVAIDGIYSAGPVIDVLLEHVTVHNMTGHGIHTVNKNASGGWAKGWQLLYVSSQYNDHGYYHEDATTGAQFASTDMTYLMCWAGACDNDGWHVDSAISSDWEACRSEFNGGHGYFVAGDSRIRMTSTDTDRSVKDGFHFECRGSGNRKVVLVGCVAARDGANDDVTAGEYAGFNIVGTSGAPHAPVVLAGCESSVSRNDSGGGVYSPKYGLMAAYAPHVSASACNFNGTTLPLNDTQRQVCLDASTRLNSVNPTTGAPTLQTVTYRSPIPAAVTAADSGYKSWAYDPALATNATAPTSGTLYLTRLQFRVDEALTKIIYGCVSIAGISLTSGQCFAGLYDSTGQRVGTTADLSGGFSASGELAFSLTGTVNVTPGFYWAALLLVGSTIPTMARSQGQVSNLGSGQLAASTRRFGTAGTSLTALPGSFTPSTTAAVITQNYWAAAA